MFTIIGGDGKEYGPVSTDQIRAWIAGGRANLDTKARAVGTEEWRRLGDHAEFGPPGNVPPLPPQSQGFSPAAEQKTYSGYDSTAAFAASEAATLEPAGRGARTGAACINAFLYFLAIIPGCLLMGMRLLKERPELARGTMLRPEEYQALAASMMPALVWIYAGLGLVMAIQCIFIAVNGKNIGKLIAGVRVVSLDDSNAGFLRGGLVRFVVPVAIMFLLNIFFPLGFLFLAVDYSFMFREDRRCLHDLMAGTKVVKA